MIHPELSLENDPIFLELKDNYPEISLDAIKTILKFHKLSSLLALKREDFFNQHQITLPRFNVLLYLKKAPQHSLYPSELAQKLEITRGTMTQLLDVMSRDELITREECDHDRRFLKIVMTPKGLEKINTVLPLYFATIGSYITPLSIEEREMMVTILNKMASTFNSSIVNT